jgi:hypothetical protein
MKTHPMDDANDTRRLPVAAWASSWPSPEARCVYGVVTGQGGRLILLSLLEEDTSVLTTLFLFLACYFLVPVVRF